MSDRAGAGCGRMSVLLLGGGIKQLPVLRAARARGWRVIVSDSREGMPCFPESDRVERFAPWEIGALARLADEERVGAVAYTTGEDPVPAAWEIARRRRLPSILTSSAVRATCDKLEMRGILARAGVDEVPHLRLDRVEDALGFGARAGYPIVIKPACSGNQIGVRIFDGPGELARERAGLDEALRASPHLVESCVEGDEMNAVGLFLGGRLEEFVVSDRLHYGRAGHFVAWAHRYPSSAPRVARESARARTEAIGRALGLRDSILFLQFVARADAEVRLVELGVRVPGGMMWRLFELVTGIDLMGLQLDLASRRGVRPAEIARGPVHPAACVRFLTAAPGPLPVGRFRGVRGLEEARAMPGVLECDLYNSFRRLTPPGAIPPLRSGADRFFALVTVGGDYAEAFGRGEAARRALRFDVDP